MGRTQTAIAIWHPVSRREVDTGFHLGQKIMRGDGHRLEILAVEYHFGNVQVKYYDAFWHKSEWEELTQFKRSLERKEK